MGVFALAQIGVNPGGGVFFILVFLIAPLVFLSLLLLVYLLLIFTGIISGTVPVWFRNRSSRFRRRAKLDELVVVAYDALTPEQNDAIFRLRHDVFVGEQEIYSEPDRDGKDPDCLHVLALMKGRIVATCRLLQVELDGIPAIKLGRLAVGRAHRRRGVGGAVVERVNTHLKEQGVMGVMHAQAHLEKWYAGLGWRRVGKPFMEAGIEHVKMRYTPGSGF